MATSDHEINRNVRGVLSRHWVDLSATSFASRQGIVRVMGELRRVGARAENPLESTNIVALDAELRKLRGVRRVHFDLVDWTRNADGEWVRAEREPGRERGEAPPGDAGDLASG